MAQQIRIEINQAGVRALLQSQEVQADLQRRANAIAQAAGGEEAGFEASVVVREGSSKLGRAMGFVTTTTAAARRAEAEDRTLTRAIDAGR